MIVHGGRRRSLRPRIDEGLISLFLAQGREEFALGKRPHVEVLDAPYRHAEILGGQGEFEQGPGGDDVEFGHLLVEVAQGGDGARALLNFVWKEQGLSGGDGAAGEDVERGDCSKLTTPSSAKTRRPNSAMVWDLPT